MSLVTIDLNSMAPLRADLSNASPQPRHGKKAKRSAPPALLQRAQDRLGLLNPTIWTFIKRAIAQNNPDDVHLCTGSAEENQRMLDTLEQSGA